MATIKTNLKCFMVVAQTLNMTQASLMLSLSQQAVSDHIKRLEQEYNTQLFLRKPRLKLTQSGELLLETLQEIQLVESNFQHRLNELKDLKTGKIVFGIGAYRAQILLPAILPVFKVKYPDVIFDIVYGETNELEDKLQKGEIDCFLGFNSKTYDSFQYIKLFEEQNFFLMSQKLAENFFTKEQLAKFSAEGISFTDIKEVPLMLNPPLSRMRNQIEQGFIKDHINPKIIMTIGDYISQIHLCEKNYGACFFPQSILPYFYENELSVYYFSIKNYNIFNMIELVLSKKQYRPEFMHYFIKLLKDYFSSIKKM